MKRLSAVTVAVVAVVGTAGAALAAWTIGSLGASGRSTARTLPVGPTPTATASGSTVTVSFSQVSVGGSVLGSLAGGGYTVKRYNGAGAAQTMNAACNTTLSGSGATLSCAEAGVSSGTWSYRVTPRLSGWTGVEGVASSAVTVSPDTTPPVVTVTLFGAAGGSGNTKVTATGTGTLGDGPVKVFVCRATPCSAGNAVNGSDANATITLVGAVWTYTSPNLGAGTYYLAAQQTDAAGNTGTSSTAGPVTR